MALVRWLLKLAFSEVDWLWGLDHKSQATSILTIRIPSGKPKRYKTSNFQYKDRSRLRKLHLFFFPLLNPIPPPVSNLFSQPYYPHTLPIKSCTIISLHCYRLATLLAGTVVYALTHQTTASHAAPTATPAITS
jgi:hypothetical protein